MAQRTRGRLLMPHCGACRLQFLVIAITLAVSSTVHLPGVVPAQEPFLNVPMGRSQALPTCQRGTCMGLLEAASQRRRGLYEGGPWSRLRGGYAFGQPSEIVPVKVVSTRSLDLPRDPSVGKTRHTTWAPCACARFEGHSDPPRLSCARSHIDSEETRFQLTRHPHAVPAGLESCFFARPLTSRTEAC